MSTKHKSYKDLVKQLDQEYRQVVKQAEKEYSVTKQEAEKASERERAAIKAKYQKVERDAKDKYIAIKESAKDAYVQLTIDTVKNAIMAIRAEGTASRAHLPTQRSLTFTSVFSTASASPSSGESAKKEDEAKAKEDQRVRELIEFAVDRLEDHLPKKAVRQRLLEEIATMAVAQQYQHQHQPPTTPSSVVPPPTPPRPNSMAIRTPAVPAATTVQSADGPPPAYTSVITEADYRNTSPVIFLLAFK
ncbi:hypothetical protein BGZ73_008877 [Actinomortierella ambigua]|nr:hypothetical protein BGZ73_008877 [Actinomortierella ambigua]